MDRSADELFANNKMAAQGTGNKKIARQKVRLAANGGVFRVPLKDIAQNTSLSRFGRSIALSTDTHTQRAHTDNTLSCPNGVPDWARKWYKS